MLKKKILGQFSKNYRTFYPKNFCLLSSKKYGFWDPEKPIPDPGVKKGTGSRIRNTAHKTG